MCIKCTYTLGLYLESLGYIIDFGKIFGAKIWFYECFRLFWEWFFLVKIECYQVMCYICELLGVRNYLMFWWIEIYILPMVSRLDNHCLTWLDYAIVIETKTEVEIHMKSYESVWQTRVLLFGSNLTSWVCLVL